MALTETTPTFNVKGAPLKYDYIVTYKNKEHKLSLPKQIKFNIEAGTADTVAMEYWVFSPFNPAESGNLTCNPERKIINPTFYHVPARETACGGRAKAIRLNAIVRESNKKAQETLLRPLLPITPSQKQGNWTKISHEEFIKRVGERAQWLADHPDSLPIMQKFKKAQKLARDDTNKSTHKPSSMSISGQVESVHGRIVIINNSGNSMLVSVKEDAKVYTCSSAAAGEQFKSETEFTAIKPGDNVNIAIEMLPDGRMEGLSIIIFSPN